MKKATLLFTFSAFALGLGLTSCVDPYATSYSTTTVTTCRPGYTIHQLPRGYRTEVIRGTTYYYHQGAYYRPHSGGKYIIVEAPRNSRYYSEYQRHHNKHSSRPNKPSHPSKPVVHPNNRPNNRPVTHPNNRPNNRPVTHPNNRPNNRPVTHPNNRPTTRPTPSRPGRPQANTGNHVINNLPKGSKKVHIRGTTYYRHGNNYYRQQGRGYVSVPNPR